MKREPVYTDMGAGITLRSDTGEETALPRYAVWTWDVVKRKHQVAECSDDLAALRSKHGEGPLVDMHPAPPAAAQS